MERSANCKKAPDMFGSLVAVGITSLVGVQAIINVAVVTSSMPVTGMQLPFFSMVERHYLYCSVKLGYCLVYLELEINKRVVV